jgi:hypothetical protein
MLRRLIAIALAALFVCTEVSRFAHLALVPHTRCAEHGELVEGGLAPAPAHGARPLERPAVSGLPAGESGGEHGHDHCAIAASASSRASAPPPSAAIAATPPAEARAPAAAAPQRPLPFALYLLAPGHSPPA